MKTKLLFLIGLTLVGQVLLQEDSTGGEAGVDETTTEDESGTGETVVVVPVEEQDGEVAPVEPVDGGGATPSGQVQNETLGDLNAQDAVLVLLNFQEGLWQFQGEGGEGEEGGEEDLSSQQQSMADYQQNVLALTQVAQAFGLPVLVVTYQSLSYGPLWSQLSQNLTNAASVDLMMPGEWAFNNQQVLQTLEQWGRRSIIMAAVYGDSGLIRNARAAKMQGYNVWAVLDSSPSYEEAGFHIASQELLKNQITQSTWLGISQDLLISQPIANQQLNQIYQQYLPGFIAPPPSNATIIVVPVQNQTVPIDGGEPIPVPIDENIPQPANNTVEVVPEGSRRRRLWFLN